MSINNVLERIKQDRDLEEENLLLRGQIIELNLLLQALDDSIKEAGASGLQSKNAAQRKMLRTLNKRVRAQRIVLALVNELGRAPTQNEINGLFERMRKEKIGDFEAARAIGFVHL